ncbi:DUF1659 domain-containing protein [Salibacterium halotolerans]|uniref:DUF1659 domain-containing protein n=1 Tax=Salibacterium halotolerans TaxID=1884432 RepID=A0A1I5SB73_9BACI|nr:DUF1659 domain-containing protein [Salibacterium halotolerans]SFP67526.1 Protein of unknown function [Salibacterium halotolerans]
MAEMINSRLTLEFNAGMDETGETVFKQKNFNNVKPEAADPSLLTVATALGQLQELPVTAVTRTNEYDITE